MGEWEYVSKLEPRVNSPRKLPANAKNILSTYRPVGLPPYVSLSLGIILLVKESSVGWLHPLSLQDKFTHQHPPEHGSRGTKYTLVESCQTAKYPASHPPCLSQEWQHQPLPIVQNKIFHQTSNAHKLVRSATVVRLKCLLPKFRPTKIHPPFFWPSKHDGESKKIVCFFSLQPYPLPQSIEICTSKASKVLHTCGWSRSCSRSTYRFYGWNQNALV